MSLRTLAMEKAYQRARSLKRLRPLASEPALGGAPDFYYWKIIDNRFPHDRHHTAHRLVVLKHDCALDQVPLAAILELWHEVVPWADKHYDYVKLNLSSMRSVEGTPHLHLYILKEKYR